MDNLSLKPRKVWFITGASTGLGLALAEAALKRGDLVVATARDPSRLGALVEQAPDRAASLKLDVTDAGAIAAAVAAAAERFGQIDVLVNNAGYGLIAGAEEATVEEIQTQFNVNVFGLFAVTRAVLPLMRARFSGRIVIMSSIAGAMGSPSGAYYSATKFAVEGFSESLALETAPLGIQILIVEPGPFRTEFLGRSITMPTRSVPGYEHLEEMRLSMRDYDGRQSGDPARAAEAILDTVGMDDMPLRLVLGRSAYRRTRDALLARLADIERTERLAIGADFPKD